MKLEKMNPTNNIEDYNTFVNNAASASPLLAPLNTNWYAIGSTATVDARDNTRTNPEVARGVPIFLLDGTKIANSNADLWDMSIDAPINRTETDAVITSSIAVFTGTNSLGAASGGPLGSSAPAAGSNRFTDGFWVGGNALQRFQVHHFYALSDILTVGDVTPTSLDSTIDGNGAIVSNDGLTPSDSVTFAFSSTESGSSFECALDGSGFLPCDSGQSYGNLADGDHVFMVRAIDTEGNIDPIPESFHWTIADVNLDPPSLAVSDQYRLLFLTSGTGDATSTNIEDYNRFVTNAASASPLLAPLNTNWYAIGSTATVDARDNTRTNPEVARGVPIFLLDGTKIADSNADLWDMSIDAPINRTETDTVITSSIAVFTGTNSLGAASGGPLGSSAPAAGSNRFTDGFWVGGKCIAALPNPSFLCVVGHPNCWCWGRGSSGTE